MFFSLHTKNHRYLEIDRLHGLLVFGFGCIHETVSFLHAAAADADRTDLTDLTNLTDLSLHGCKLVLVKAAKIWLSDAPRQRPHPTGQVTGGGKRPETKGVFVTLRREENSRRKQV